jgi:hypothetical protein
VGAKNLCVPKIPSGPLTWTFSEPAVWSVRHEYRGLWVVTYIRTVVCDPMVGLSQMPTTAARAKWSGSVALVQEKGSGG